MLGEALSLIAEGHRADGLRLLRLHSLRAEDAAEVSPKMLSRAWSTARELEQKGYDEVAAALFSYCFPHMSTFSVDDLKALCSAGLAREVLILCSKEVTEFETRFIGTAYALERLGRLDDFVENKYVEIVDVIESRCGASRFEADICIQLFRITRGLAADTTFGHANPTAPAPIEAWIGYLRGELDKNDVHAALVCSRDEVSWAPARMAVDSMERWVETIDQIIELCFDSGQSITENPAFDQDANESEQPMLTLFYDLIGISVHNEVTQLAKSLVSDLPPDVPNLEATGGSFRTLRQISEFAVSTSARLFRPKNQVEISDIEQGIFVVSSSYGPHSPIVVGLRQLLVLALLKAGHTARALSEARLLETASDQPRQNLRTLRALAEAVQLMTQRAGYWLSIDPEVSLDQGDSESLLDYLLIEIYNLQRSFQADERLALVYRLVPVVSIYRDIAISPHVYSIPELVTRIGSACDDLIHTGYRDHEAIFRLRFTQAFLLESLGRIEHAHRVLVYVQSRAESLNLSSVLKSWTRVALVRVLLYLGQAEEAEAIVTNVSLQESESVIELYAKSTVLIDKGNVTEARIYRNHFYDAAPSPLDLRILRLPSSTVADSATSAILSSTFSTSESI
ncbi:hypothetical protein [Brevibacterium sp. UCMA 11752]|uniref:hypothetical protein n=1 Tax=Brevibacterium sp. UCMA 11752 TaxID=2745946 RepID=UPI001F1F2191|nr:hypothetical protein [Brevibacterium sp. UCMA 11752]MCF2585822.1 hypothetical protein [Brevibacterium sp. UCMA 11752]